VLVSRNGGMAECAATATANATANATAASEKHALVTTGQHAGHYRTSNLLEH